MQFESICVIGLGYIGLPTACMFARCGKQVYGVDVNHHVLLAIEAGVSPIQEPGMADIVAQVIHEQTLVVGTTLVAADAFIIAVPTPFYEDKRADLRYVTAAAESIVPYLRKDCLVILESTSPPRTTIDIVQPILERSGLSAGEDFRLAYSPERVLPGQILQELVQNARVIGGIDELSAHAGKALYESFVQGDIITTDATTAEMVKLMENTYRDVNIAIANEFSRLADRFGMDVWEAIQIANRHPRVEILRPGTGVGGHCISVDPWFLVEKAPDITELIKTARQVNDGQPVFVVSLVERIVGALPGKTIGVLGLSYKPDTDDFRESSAVAVVRQLQQKGAIITAYDPYATNGIEDMQLAGAVQDVFINADLVVLLVGHTQFKDLTPVPVLHLSKSRSILDTTNTLSPVWQEAGFQVYTLGNGKTSCQ